LAASLGLAFLARAEGGPVAFLLEREGVRPDGQNEVVVPAPVDVPEVVGEQLLLAGSQDQPPRADEALLALEVRHEVGDRVQVGHHDAERGVVEDVHEALRRIEVGDRERQAPVFGRDHEAAGAAERVPARSRAVVGDDHAVEP
jgi:hypothetical protein